MIRILCVFGTRPEVIKMAPIIKELRNRPDHFEIFTCATAQHREMLDQMTKVFDIQPDIDFNLMQPDQSTIKIAARVLTNIEPVLLETQPDWILVQGDTTTVLSSALAAHYLRVKIGHVEAGLRTWDRWHPFPEEMNRVLADHLSDLCFVPTEGARDNLLEDGISPDVIRITGNTVIDALLWAADQPPSKRAMEVLGHLGLSGIPEKGQADLILVTAHRRESFGAPLVRICTALLEIARRADGDLKLVYPVHPNPRVRETVYRLLSNKSNIELIEPVDYLTMVALMKRSKLILTDSGGIQEEAPTLGIPVLVMRETTERPEAVQAGVVRLVGTNQEDIVSEVSQLLQDKDEYAMMSRAVNPYGDGHASERIADALLQWER